MIGPGVGDKFWKLYDVCMSSCKNYFVNTGVHPYYKKLNPLLDAIGLSWEESSAIGIDLIPFCTVARIGVYPLFFSLLAEETD